MLRCFASMQLQQLPFTPRLQLDNKPFLQQPKEHIRRTALESYYMSFYVLSYVDFETPRPLQVHGFYNLEPFDPLLSKTAQKQLL